MNASAHTRRNHTIRQSFVSGLCTRCASQYHDFREITGCGVVDDYFPKISLSQAWIDGRHHVLRSAVRECVICSDCGKNVTSIYLPVG
jgi:hypothetical protein